MATPVLDLSDLLKGIPSGAWVAVSEETNEVVAFGADAQDVLRRANEQGIKTPFIVRVPDQASAMFF